MVVNNWADDNFDHSGLGFIGGASLTVNHEVHPIAASAMPTFGRAPQWGSQWKKFVSRKRRALAGGLCAVQFPALRKHLAGSRP